MYARYIPPPQPKPAPAADPAWESPAEADGAGEPRGVAAPAPPVPSDLFSYARYVPPARGSAPGGGAEDVKKRKRDGEVDEREGKKVKAGEDEALEDETENNAAQDVDGAVEGGEPVSSGILAVSEKEERRRKKEEKRLKKEERRRKAEQNETSPPRRASNDNDPESTETETPKKSKTSKDEQTAEPQDSDVEMTAPTDGSPSQPTDTTQTEKKPKRDKKKKKKHRETDELEEAEDTVRRHHKALLEKKAKALRNARLPSPISTEPAPEASDQQTEDKTEAEPEAHGLKPLPQPEPVALDTAPPVFDGLPPWIADPIRVEESTRVPFTTLGIPERVSRALESKGYKDAFAVQTAAIPLLLPTAKHLQGDVLVSAATGSGKTLAYAIPIVRDISLGVVTRLRALVVLPTRELVKQAKEAFESVSAAFEGQGRKRVRIGIAYGSQSLKVEQAGLVTREEVYDPEASQRAEDDEAGRDALLDDDRTRSGVVKGTLPGHVVSFGSTVDVLICTPGRLVDHIRQTKGFTLDYVRWLVVDEGDKLLEQSYQNWIPAVTSALRTTTPPLGARDFPGSSLSGVRKVFLSATLTSRGSLAAMRELELRRPRLVVLGAGTGAAAEHVLPEKLREYAIRLKDENLKPLYLNELLLSERLRGGPSASPEPESDSDSEDSNSDSDAHSPTKALFSSTALIFTKSNESALRLTRLLSHLTPALTPLTATLTSATPPHVRRRTIAQFAARRIRLLVASDLVARGLDLPLLDHVVNYDLPPSVEGYVHRVGRTARAGREGCAWSLVPDGKEGGWFWGEVVKGTKIRRAVPVERVMLDEEVGEERVGAYERALGELAKEASGRKGRD